MSTIAVTGGAGFIGSHVVDSLLEAGHRVLVLDDLSSGRRENLGPGAELFELDIGSPEAAAAIATNGVEILIHHAAQMDIRRSTADPGFDARVNILGTLNLLTAGVGSGLRRAIFASTGGAIYGEQDAFPADEDHATRPLSPYGVSKLAGERYLYYFHHTHGLDVTCLRYANVYGGRQNPHGEAGVVAIFLERLLRGEACTIYGDGLQTRDFVHVSDVVSANLAALGLAGFGVFNVGTGRETSINDLYERLATAVGSELEARHAPGKPGEQRRSVIDPTRLSALGVPAPIGLELGLEKTVSWFRERAATPA